MSFTFANSSTSDTVVATEAEKTYAKGNFDEIEEIYHRSSNKKEKGCINKNPT